MATIGILCFPEAEELDFVGPWEVYTAAAALNRTDRVFLVGVEPGLIRCAKGMTVLAETSLADCPPLDVVVVPGGSGRRRESGNAVLLDFLRAHARTGSWVTSVCTGAFVLASAGLLTGPATTHWMHLDELRDLGIEVRGGVRYVVHGKVATAAGVSAGIDLSLWLVAELHGAAFAEEVRRYIQYDPDPLRTG